MSPASFAGWIALFGAVWLVAVLTLFRGKGPPKIARPADPDDT